jgi:phage terminase Nu1 subunit (DNA packaging protein)
LSGAEKGGQTLSVDQIATLLMLDPRRVQQLVKEGWIPRAKHGEYQFVPSLQGYIRSLRESVQRRGPQELEREAAEEDIGIKKARREKLELENAAQRGELLDRSEVEAAWLKTIAVIKNQLLNLPGKMAPRIADNPNVAAIEAELEAVIYDTLTQLANTAIEPADAVGSVSAQGVNEFDAAAEIDSEPMG